jgi:lysyl-tRNA synthetase class 2
MREVGDLLKLVLNVNKIESFSYEQIFTQILHLDPYTSSLDELKVVAKLNKLEIHDLAEYLNQDYDTWLQLLFTHLIEPKIGLEYPVFIYDFPESQAMLARVRDESPRVASRFEVYFQGVELANGFHELNDAVIQRARFSQDLKARKHLNLPPVPLDENFLAALLKLPDCSGVAIGVDRLLLLTAKYNSLNNVLCYPFVQY